MAQQRPQSIAQFLDLMQTINSTAELKIESTFESYPTDVFISTFAKSGTTWMQQIVHQLRAEIDDDFNDIYQVVPWIERCKVLNCDASDSQLGAFRAFKSHLSYADLPKPGRFIIVIRDPESVIPSWHRFFEGWRFETGSVSVKEFASEFYFNIFADHQAHLETALERVNESDTLVLTYEDMVSRATEVPAVVAKFLQLNIDSQTMKSVVQRCSREYMYLHKSKFEERLLRKYMDTALSLPIGGKSLKVNRTATQSKLCHQTISELDSMWSKTITQKFGFTNYQQLRRSLPNPLKANRE